MTMGDDLPTLSESEGIRYLHFDSEWVQGAMKLKKPSELVLAYTRQMMAWLLFLKPGPRSQVGILGLGAGSLLRFVLRHTPASAVTVEWNPDVVGICRTYFRLAESSRSTIDQCDAAQWVNDSRNIDRYQALMVDLYDGQAQGPVRDSIDFYQGCHRTLCETGVMTVNLFGNHGSFMGNLDTIRQVFGGRVLLLPEVDEGNCVVLALKGPALAVSVQQFLDRADAVELACGLPTRQWARQLLARNGVEDVFQA